MTDEKVKEIYDNCTPESQERWKIMTMYFHMKSEMSARAEADKNKSLHGCIVIYEETSLHEFI